MIIDKTIDSVFTNGRIALKSNHLTHRPQGPAADSNLRPWEEALGASGHSFLPVNTARTKLGTDIFSIHRQRLTADTSSSIRDQLVSMLTN